MCHTQLPFSITKIIIGMVFISGLILPTTVQAQEWEEVTPPGDWIGAYFLDQVGPDKYFVFNKSEGDELYRYLHIYREGQFIDITPPGSWNTIIYWAELNGEQIFSFSNSTGSHLFSLKNDAWSDLTPAGDIPPIWYLSEKVGEKLYFISARLQTTHFVYSLYTLDENGLTNITPDGTWIDLTFEANLNRKGYYLFRDSSSGSSRLFEVVEEDTKDITPEGARGVGPFLTELNGKAYFPIYLPHPMSSKLYRLDATGWDDITPAGTWTDSKFLTTVNNKAYFTFIKKQLLPSGFWDVYVFELEQNTLTDITPTGTWRQVRNIVTLNHIPYFILTDDSPRKYFYRLDQGTLSEVAALDHEWTNLILEAKVAEVGYFLFWNNSFNDYLHSFDGTTVTNLTPPGNWPLILFEAELNDKAYFSADDSEYNTHLLATDGKSLEEIALPGTWNGISFRTEQNGQKYFSFYDGTLAYLYALDQNDFFTPAPLPDGNWQWIDFLDETSGGKFLQVQDENNKFHIFKGTLLVPELQIRSNNHEIVSGDDTPSLANNTAFGPVSTLDGWLEHTFTISNTGLAPLTLSNTPPVDLAGPAATEFSVINYPTALIAPQEATTFTIRFAPSTIGLRTAQVSIANNDPDENIFNFTIQGTGQSDAGAENRQFFLPMVIKN